MEPQVFPFIILSAIEILTSLHAILGRGERNRGLFEGTLRNRGLYEAKRTGTSLTGQDEDERFWSGTNRQNR